MMKNKIIRIGFLIFSVLFCLCFSSCKVFISLTQNQNGDVKVLFSGIPEEAFVNTIKSFLEVESSSVESNNAIIDTKEIKDFLLSSGFFDVEVSNKIGAAVDIKMTIPKDKTFIFDSHLLEEDEANNSFSINLSPATLQTFYANADEQIISILDILISPAFYGEEISEEEYIETIASLYGNDVAAEMNKSEIYITLKNKSGKTLKKSLPLKTLLTLKQSIKIGW